MNKKVLKLAGNINLVILIISYLILKASFIIFFFIILPVIEHLILLKEILLFLSVFYLRKSYLKISLILGGASLALYGIFISVNYQFFNISFTIMLTFQEGLSGQGIFPLLDRVLFVYLLIFYSTLLFYSRRKIIKEESIIRKVLLDLSTKHTRLEVRELSERTNSDADTLKKVALEMIENNEIFARYFSASRSIVFNQEANTEEIDRLLSLYQKWEEKQVGKI